MMTQDERKELLRLRHELKMAEIKARSDKKNSEKSDVPENVLALWGMVICAVVVVFLLLITF